MSKKDNQVEVVEATENTPVQYTRGDFALNSTISGSPSNPHSFLGLVLDGTAVNYETHRSVGIKPGPYGVENLAGEITVTGPVGYRMIKTQGKGNARITQFFDWDLAPGVYTPATFVGMFLKEFSRSMTPGKGASIRTLTEDEITTTVRTSSVSEFLEWCGSVLAKKAEKIGAKTLRISNDIGNEVKATFSSKDENTNPRAARKLLVESGKLYKQLADLYESKGLGTADPRPLKREVKPRVAKDVVLTSMDDLSDLV